jgi:ribosome-associated heat shock protein Hsp15
MCENKAGETRVRIDKWLWAARFFKTRALAAEAVQGGKVHVNGARVKPARALCVGDRLRIQKGRYEFVVAVRGLKSRRGPASEAQQLYEEDVASVQARQSLLEQHKLGLAVAPVSGGRPDKKARRQWQRMHRR